MTLVTLPMRNRPSTGARRGPPSSATPAAGLVLLPGRLTSAIAAAEPEATTLSR
ncbi:hypothetical protein ACIBHY_14355 [Nonomuraea sp. NPDC050547]|uniref:hypothetical protein n=1 Tax=unclassified Nonomuraea TaxID=2593643 RepID=UPI0037B08AF7